jgi:hypothetical protein
MIMDLDVLGFRMDLISAYYPNCVSPAEVHASYWQPGALYALCALFPPTGEEGAPRFRRWEVVATFYSAEGISRAILAIQKALTLAKSTPVIVICEHQVEGKEARIKEIEEGQARGQVQEDGRNLRVVDLTEPGEGTVRTDATPAAVMDGLPLMSRAEWDAQQLAAQIVESGVRAEQQVQPVRGSMSIEALRNAQAAAMANALSVQAAAMANARSAEDDEMSMVSAISSRAYSTINQPASVVSQAVSIVSAPAPPTITAIRPTTLDRLAAGLPMFLRPATQQQPSQSPAPAGQGVTRYGSSQAD